MREHSRPRICYILPSFDIDTGSHFFHVYDLLRAVRRDLNVFLVIERARSDPRELAFPFYVQKFSFAPLRFGELVFVLFWQRFRGVRNFYTHYSFFGGFASWCVARLSGGVAYYWNCGMPWLYRRAWFEETVFQFVMRHSIFVTGTPEVAEVYRRHYKLAREHTRVIPNYITLDRFESGESRELVRRRLGILPDAEVVLFVHHLSRRKGADRIPEIAASVTNAQKHAMVIVIGEGPELNAIPGQIRSRGIESSVRLEGGLPYRDVISYFRAADAFLMPSEEEGFPHVLLEAMAAGLPYVASDVGGVREITPPILQQYVVPPGESAVFAAGILELLAKPAGERAMIARELTLFVRRYDISAVAPQFVKLFQAQP